MTEVAASEPTFTPDTDDARPDLLALCREERRRAVGFDQDAELRDDRERALNYYKGDLSKDIQALDNRSTAVSSDLSDAVETCLADIVEIFIGGDDVVAFIPQKEADVEPAKQETAYLHHVAFQENPGFLNLYTAIKDALLLKTGVFHWEWEEEIDEQDEEFTGKNAVEMHLAAQDGEISNVKAEKVVDLRSGEQTYSFTVTRTTDNSRAKYWAIAPEDFAAASDTVNIAETAYCCERQRPRAQDLIARGFDEALVRKLPAYGYVSDEDIQQARDQAGEHNNLGFSADDTDENLKQVEIHKHCIRVPGKNGKLEIFCLYTDAEETFALAEPEEINAITYAVGSPYLISHRLIGRSLADLLIEIMKIKTALYRMCLDSGYFALNQRNEVAMDRANDFTISDLLRNEPAMPVRSKSGDAVRPLQAGQLGFDAYKAIEFFSTVAEGRTGIVRNAQGLNPDTLHDTKGGMMALLSASQKRVRMIARCLAETLIKPMFLGLHATIRENSQSTRQAQLLGTWVDVDPTKWGSRNAMSVEVGLGAAGKDSEIMAMNQIIGLQKAAVEGGGYGILVTAKNLHKSATDMAKKLGVKAPEEYFTDPESPESQQAAAAKAQQPDPLMAKVQMEGQVKQATLQQDGQIKSAQMEQDGQQKAAQQQADAALSAQKLQQEGELKRYQIDQELVLKREQLQAELQLRREQMLAELELQRELGHANVNAKVAAGTSEVGIGGDPG